MKKECQRLEAEDTITMQNNKVLMSNVTTQIRGERQWAKRQGVRILGTSTVAMDHSSQFYVHMVYSSHCYRCHGP